jgi:tousled-like kinase
MLPIRMTTMIESWEEGYATKEWQHRKEQWQQKMQRLLQRQEQQKQQSSEKEKENNHHTSTTTTSTATFTSRDTGVVARLESQQAKEAMEIHMETLRREEQELIAAEQTLNEEKACHIRALKRVEAEDSSRFHHRPTLHDRYVLDRLLGKGGFSEVWRAYDLKELREVAVKIHQLDPRWSDSKKDNYTKHVTREYEIHRDVRHARIVSLYDVFEIDANSFATVLECCNGTDLETLLKAKKRLPERHARSILLQILSGMQYLSQPSGSRQGIIHYDLKPGNILFDEMGDAKITDFGLSKIVDAPDSAESMELTSQGAGTYWYLPPECFIMGEQVRISNKVDVWSIGVIFYQMLYGRRPFGEGQTQDKILADHTMLNAQQVHFPEKPTVSEEGKDFLRLCLTYDQAFRPTIAQLCENAYILYYGKAGIKPN